MRHNLQASLHFGLLGFITLIGGLAAPHALAARNTTPIPTKPLEEALESRFNLPVKVTRVQELRTEIPTATASDYRVGIVLDRRHKATCELRVIRDRRRSPGYRVRWGRERPWSKSLFSYLFSRA